jgi:hypothetical protein
MSTEANVQYDYGIDKLGSFSGGTAPSGSYVPHPVYSNMVTGEDIIQLNNVKIGGFDGLNS